jgi:hypothetical protein
MMDISQSIRIAVAWADIVISEIGHYLPNVLISIAAGALVWMVVFVKCRRQS